MLTNYSNFLTATELTLINLPARSALKPFAGTLFPSTQRLAKMLWLHTNHTELMVGNAMFPHYMLFPDARGTLPRLGWTIGCRPARRLSNGVACRVVKAARRRSRSRARDNSSSSARWLVLPSIVPFRSIGRAYRAPAARLEPSVFSATPRLGGGARSRNRYPIQGNSVNITSCIFLKYSSPLILHEN